METNSVDWKIPKLGLRLTFHFGDKESARKFDCAQNVIWILSFEGSVVLVIIKSNQRKISLASIIEPIGMGTYLELFF